MKRKKLFCSLLTISSLLVGGLSLVSCSDDIDVTEQVTPGDDNPSTDPVTYTVTYTQSDDYTISGLSSSYEAGATVSFAVTITNEAKELEEVAWNSNVITADANGDYSFTMPSANVVLTISLADVIVTPDPDPDPDPEPEPEPEPVTYTVTYTQSDDYTISGLSSTYEAGATVSFAVTVTNEAKELEEVAWNSNVITADANGDYSFTMPSANVVLTISLADVIVTPDPDPDPEPEPEPEPVTYTVTYTQSDDYTISGLSSTYEVGATVSFTVTVTNEAKELKEVAWNSNVITADLEGVYSFTMPEENVVLTITLADIVVTPEPEPVTYTVTYTESEDYLVSGIQDSYEAEETVVFTIAVINEAKELKEVAWNSKVITADVEGVYSFTMPEENVVLTITLDDVQFTISYQASDNDPEGLNVEFLDEELSTLESAKKGDTVNVAISHSSELHTINTVFANDTEISKLDGSSMYQFTMPAENVTIKIDWKVTAVNKVTYTSNDEYTITFESGTEFKEGETVSFTVTPIEGKLISSVEANGTPLEAKDGTYSFTMPDVAVELVVTLVDDPSFIDSLEELYALSELESGENYSYTLGADLELTKAVTIPSGVNLTLDLNGHELTLIEELKTSDCIDNAEVPWLIENHGNLTLNDSKGDALIAGGTGALMSYEDGSVIINDGITFTSYQADGHGQTVYIESTSSNPSVINDINVYSGGLALAAANTTMNDGLIVSISSSKLEGTGYAYAVWSDNSTFNGGDVYGIQGGITVNSGSNELNGINSTTNTQKAIELFVNKMEETGQTDDKYYPFINDTDSTERIVDDKLNLNYLTTQVSEGVYYALYVDNSTEKPTIKITDGAFESEYRYTIYACCYGSIDIQGGTFSTLSSTYSIIYNGTAGGITISGGSFKHTTETSHTALTGYLDENYELVDNGDGYCVATLSQQENE